MLDILGHNCIVNQRTFFIEVAQFAVQSVTIRAIMAMVVVVLDLMVDVMRLHLKNEVSSCDIGILRVENRAVALKTPADLVPASLVKAIKVISPSHVKCV